MKKIFLTAVSGVLFSTLLVAQSVGINNTTPDASAILDVTSSTKGMLIPRTSTTSRMAITNPAKGLMLYDTTTSSFWFHNGADWNEITAGANGWNLTGNAGTDSALNFIGTTDDKPFHFRLNNLWAGEMHPTNGNIFLGMGAGQANTTAGKNTAIGTGALQTQSFDNGGSPWETANVAIGYEALTLNNPTSTTSGISNTAVGTYAMHTNSIGFDNTALGASALYYNNTGYENTAIGRQALFSNTDGLGNTATGYKALRFNNQNYNTANGYMALYSNTFGFNNIAVGSHALFSNTTGGYNTANGTYALYFNTTGSSNTANGVDALYNNTTGSSNTAIGASALRNQSFNNGGNTWASNNVAVGFQALYSNQSTSTSNGINNTAVGTTALYNNTYGTSNTANGYNALYNNTSGYNNTAMGSYALLNNTGIVDGNTAIGYAALRNNIGGYFNTAVGSGADNDLSSSNFNTLIGSGAHCSASNSVVIGYNSFTNTNNLALLGNPITLFTGGYSTWTNFASDKRLKTSINEDVKGLDFIMRLRPVTYHLDIRGLYNQWGISPYGKEENEMTAAMKTDMDNNIRNKEAIRMSGFIAQEVEKAAQEAGYDFDGIKKPAHDKDNYGLAYATFVVPLVKAVQELFEKTIAQNKIIEQQQNKIEQQQQQYDILLKRVEALEKKN
jgi:trimeric autotransporter adhesin